MRLFWAGIVFLSFASARSSEPTKAKSDYFENKVRPLLADKCFGCHSEAMNKSKGNLTLDTLAGMLAGGDLGPAIVAGKSKESRLVEAVRHTNDDLKMPPKEKLKDDEVAILAKWIDDGAVWPNAKASGKRKPGTITDEDRRWWSFAPIKASAPPKAGDGWARNEIDRFVAETHAAHKLAPAPEANRLALIRRLTFDLHGLPPTPAEIDAFANDPSPTAYENLVERLLASPRYGERQARLWLDLVRYADSDGYRIDDYRPNAWRYRDYVIRSFNADKGYDRFVREQLAGDELYPGDVDARIATGYLRHWIYEYNNRDARGQWNTILNDITDTTSDVFLGLGLQCARCHDHKFDPLLQKDYFRLQAFFAALNPRDDLFAATEAEVAEHVRKNKEWEAKTAAIREKIEAIEGSARKKAEAGAVGIFPEDVQAMMRKPAKERTPYEQQIHDLAYRQVEYEYGRIDKHIPAARKEELLALRRQLVPFESLKPAPLPTAFAATDVGPAASPITIPKRGDAPVEPGYPTILQERPASIVPMPASTGRRATLANWLVDPENPLTARVMVNRIWQQHFGRGLAVNASDFGHLGEPPTHPELLDWLANRFVADGWSLKSLHRRIVLSATYRQSAGHPDPANGRLVDPENRWLWKAPVRRLEAEQIRDAILAVTGELSLKEGGPGVAGSESRRSIYGKILRNTRDPLLDVFDAPYWISSAASRDTTTTPVQSLLLVNSPAMIARGKAFAARLARDEADHAKRVDRAYRLAYGRPAIAKESAAALAYLDAQSKRIDPKKSGSSQAEFVGAKLPYRDGQAADLKLGTSVGFQLAGDKLPAGDFTIETFVYPRSVAETGAVRTLAAHFEASPKPIGWSFGITGKQSRRKPQTLVMQIFGKKRDGTIGEEAVFSDQHVALNKPYYFAAAVRLASKDAPGSITFYLKDLSNDDEPLLTAKLPHAIVGGFDHKKPMTLGRRGASAGADFDGLLDDVRLSGVALGVDELLFTREGINKHTLGYWQFEPKPGVFVDGSGHGLDIRPADAKPSAGPRDARQTAWADFCHVLLNSSEFLYVE
jgi:Protein of unknown function (DUF1553)/Protein of unknown function (DUF1549)/Planctomycete cytochrome C